MKYFILVAFLVLTPVLSYAQVKTFQNLPGLENAGNLTTAQYIDALYVIAIVAASILAVFKLIIAGVKYMTSEIVPTKSKAKEDIQGALLGLLIILGAVTLLSTINPNLTNLDFLRNADPTKPVQGGSRTSKPSPVVNTQPTIIDCGGTPTECGATDETGENNCSCQ